MDPKYWIYFRTEYFLPPPPEGRVSLNKPGATCSGREKINTKLTQHLQGCARENKKNCSAISPHTETWQQLGKLGRSCKKQDLGNVDQDHTQAEKLSKHLPIWDQKCRKTHKNIFFLPSCPYKPSSAVQCAGIESQDHFMEEERIPSAVLSAQKDFSMSAVKWGHHPAPCIP